jgi:hypothetical protein
MGNKKEDNLIKIFQKAKLEPNLDLAENVWRVIILRDKRIVQFKLWVFACIGFASFAGLFPALNILLSDLSRSGLYEYLSLIFEEGSSVLSYWKELAFSLAQSLPMTSIVLTLSLIFVFFLSLRYLMRQIGKNQSMNFAILST